MNWKDFKLGGFAWSIADGVLVLGPLDDGRIIVHEGGEDPYATLKPIEQVKAELAEKRTIPAPPPEAEGSAPSVEVTGSTSLGESLTGQPTPST